MPRRFIITPKAEQDYFDIWEYIAEDSVVAADPSTPQNDRGVSRSWTASSGVGQKCPALPC